MDAERPDLLRVLVRSLVACVSAELVVAGGLTAAGWSLSGAGWAYVVGFGLGAGVALAVGEAALRRFGLLAALLAGAALSPLALLGGLFELAFVETWSSRQATETVVASIRAAEPADVLAFVVAALCLHGPLLVALRLRASPPVQSLAMLAGGSLGAGAVAVAAPGWLGEDVTWRELPLLLGAPALVVPVARRAGDRLLRRARGRSAAPRSSPRLPLERLGLLLVLGLLAALCARAARNASGRPVAYDLEDRRLRGADPETLVNHADRWFSTAETVLFVGGRSFVLGPTGTWVAAPPAPPSVARRLRLLAEQAGRDHPPTHLRTPADGWYAEAAVRGNLTAVRRLAGLEGPPGAGGWAPHGDRGRWLLAGARLGDPLCMALHGHALVETDRPTLSHYGPPPPGPRPPEEAARVQEGLGYLRRAVALEASDRVVWPALRSLRLSPSDTVDEALARLDEAQALCVALATRGNPRTWGELHAIARARAALLEWAGR